MLSGLPCVDATTECIAQLQEVATVQTLLLEIDGRIEEINARIEEAKAENKSQSSSQSYRPCECFEPTTVTTSDSGSQQTTTKQTETPRKNAQIFTNPVRIVNELLAAVGIPLFDSLLVAATRIKNGRSPFLI